MFFDGVPPPMVHMHIRLFKVRELPIGDSLDKPINLTSRNAFDDEIPELDKTKFDLWLRELWREKDQSITRFFESGRFSSKQLPVYKIPLKLRNYREFLDAFGLLLPTIVAHFWGKVKTQ